jgi:hypothetical protein
MTEYRARHCRSFVIVDGELGSTMAPWLNSRHPHKPMSFGKCQLCRAGKPVNCDRNRHF